MTRQLDTPLYERIDAKFEIADLRGSDEKISALRKKAYAVFKSLGFPSIKNEEWKHTSILPFLKEDYEWEIIEQAISKEEFDRTARLIAKHLEAIQNSLKGEQKGAYRIVNINGRLNKDLSVFPDSAQLNILTFEEAMDKPSFQQYFGEIATLEQNAFAALNTALFTDGLFLEVPQNTVVDKPLHIVNVFLSESNLWIQPRNLMVIGQGASLEIIETVLSDETRNTIFINGLTEIEVGANAHFHHYDLQTGREGMRFVQRTEARQDTHSNYSNYTFTLPGSDFIRNNLTIHLEEPELESHMYGLYLSAGKQLVDNHTEVHHKKPHGESTQLYKGVLLDQSKAVFNGKIYVYEDAQKTNAFQQSNNILFSDKATVNAKPQLEIFADDVKCSHGTTIGQIDKEALFYLQSRGLSEVSAKNMMVNAFAFDVTQKIKNAALRVYLEKLVAREMAKTSA
jgi:Fe-S cluster assembly protein SufD